MDLTALVDAAVTAAARAPSAHNTQPWVPGEPVVEGPEAVLEVGVDPDRALPEADPTHMDLLLGLGCWVEAFAIAAAGSGLSTTVTVTGAAPDVTVVLRVGPGDVDEYLTTADLAHRQVDRGRLVPDPAALQAALGDAETGWPDGVVAGLVPEATWRRLAPVAETHLTSTPALIRETVAWLRLDPADPRHDVDGLSAACLRLPPRAGGWAARLLRSRLAGRIIDRADLWHRPLRFLVRGVARVQTVGALRRRPPARLVLGTRSMPGSAGEWVALGRVLMRLWLILDRHGLRVSVQSELKDTPGTVGFLRRLVDGEPFAVFSVGRSAQELVPRSARRY